MKLPVEFKNSAPVAEKTRPNLALFIRVKQSPEMMMMDFCNIRLLEHLSLSPKPNRVRFVVEITTRHMHEHAQHLHGPASHAAKAPCRWRRQVHVSAHSPTHRHERTTVHSFCPHRRRAGHCSNTASSFLLNLNLTHLLTSNKTGSGVVRWYSTGKQCFQR
jgi:hypothetical protein